jgi:hypothetical protein
MITNDRINLYKEAMSLEEKRGQLQGQLDGILIRLSEIKTQLFDNDGYVRSSTGPASIDRTTSGRSARGALKLEILRALTAAGSSGVKVKDLAATLGVKAANIHSWFQTSGKRVDAIKKIGESRYRLEGSVSQSELDGPSPKAKTKSGRRKLSTRPLSGRGELATRIVAALKEAGPEGITVRDLANKLEVKKYKNLFIWFATTGKKNPAIQKIGTARYIISDTPVTPPVEQVAPSAESPTA